jgi:hypothetical protein
MTTKVDLIRKAISILDNQDFYYYMEDYAYTRGAYASAKGTKNHFVEVTNEIGGEIRETLRTLWIATYNYCHCFGVLYSNEEKAAIYKAEINELTEKVNGYIAALGN